jgi:hypothetical protein
MTPAARTNEPARISSGVKRAPSALRSPLARTWSPTFRSANVAGRASAGFKESGA